MRTQMVTLPGSAQAYNILGNVLSLVGGVCSMCCSLLLPSFFFLLLCWRDIGPAMRMAVCGLMFGGVALMLLITADNVIAIKHQSLRPTHSRSGSGKPRGHRGSCHDMRCTSCHRSDCVCED